ncbi:hypothetical protein V6Z11_A02G089400 [Gossypium hirsutum]
MNVEQNLHGICLLKYQPNLHGSLNKYSVANAWTRICNKNHLHISKIGADVPELPSKTSNGRISRSSRTNQLKNRKASYIYIYIYMEVVIIIDIKRKSVNRNHAAKRIAKL